MELSQLKAFISVAKYRSFSETANQLHLTQPAISKRIATLEYNLGVTLFDRIGHQIQLTEAGKRLLPRAIKLLNDAEDCKRHIKNLKDKISGKLSLAASHHIGLHRLPQILKGYAKQYPEVELDFQFLESEEAHDALRDGEIELALITLPLEENDHFKTCHLWNDPLKCMVSEGHTLSNMKNVDMGTLSSFPILLPESKTYTRQIIEKPFKDKNLNLKTLMTANELEHLRMMVEIGLGWSLLPSSMLRKPLVEVRVTDLNIIRKLGYIRHKERTLSNAAKAFISHLE